MLEFAKTVKTDRHSDLMSLYFDAKIYKLVNKYRKIILIRV